MRSLYELWTTTDAIPVPTGWHLSDHYFYALINGQMQISQGGKLCMEYGAQTLHVYQLPPDLQVLVNTLHALEARNVSLAHELFYGQQNNIYIDKDVDLADFLYNQKDQECRLI